MENPCIYFRSYEYFFIGNAFKDTPVKDWSRDDIRAWSDAVLHRKLEIPSEEETFSVIQAAMKLEMGYMLRNVGVMAVHLLISNQETGCLGKISTGIR